MMQVTRKPGVCLCGCGAELPVPRPCNARLATDACRKKCRREVEKARRSNERARHIERGIIIPRRLLSPEQVRAIRACRGTLGPTQAGRIHGAKKWTVCEIWAGRAYVHVQ